MDVVERQVPPDIADVAAVGGEQLADDLLGLAAVRALEVPVLEERHGGVRRSPDVVACRIDIVGEVEDVLGGPRELAGPHLERGDGVTARSASHASAGASTTVASAPSFASASRSPLKARLEISSDTVNPIPAHAPAAVRRGGLSGERGPCSWGREAIQVPAAMPTGLPIR